MNSLLSTEPIDYLMIGHVTQDIKPGGFSLGGTASFSALTARALGLRVGIVTAHAEGLKLPELAGIPISAVYSEHSTTFENIPTPQGRVQYLHHLADTLTPAMIPPQWRSAPIVHLGPVAQEIDPTIIRLFPEAQICLTPQGWMRGWDKTGKVHFSDWPEARYVLEQASAAVLSIEDVQRNESQVEEMLTSIRVLVVTEGAKGARLYWNGDLRCFRPPLKEEIEPTGAGDIFAAAFFYRLYATRDPWEAARFATLLAANSVTRPGLQGVPTPEEVQSALMEIISKPLPQGNYS
ncbi:MAG TPA: PfkB family carbohydrate kinase [Anaerolineaceae bacterium]|nr:PfkB family carbohydrate kinase [Anaerolineaceae bacterium]